jgi:hypothetical protein
MKTNGKKTRKATGKRQQQIRMDDDLKERVNGYREKLEKEKDLEVSFSSAVRSLIEKGLEAAQ